VIDQAIGRHHLVRVEEQEREQRTLLPASERDLAGGALDLQRTEDPELERVASFRRRAAVPVLKPS